MAAKIQFKYLTNMSWLGNYPDQEDVPLLVEMHEKAKKYLTSHSWCPKITESYLGYGVGGVVALFLFRLSPPINGVDEWLWVVVGDLPSAYMVIDDAENPAKALEAYCTLMEEWANSALRGEDLSERYPVEVPPTAENARLLFTRVQFLRDKVIPEALAPPSKPDWGEED